MHLTVERTPRGWAVFSEAWDEPSRMSKVYPTYDLASAARLRLISDLNRSDAEFQERIAKGCGLR